MPPKKGYKQSEEHRNKVQHYISLRKGKTLEELYGKEKAEKIRLNQSISHKGKKYSDEFKLKMSKIVKGRFKGISLEMRIGKERADATKLKMSNAKNGYIPHNKGKKDIDTYGLEQAEKIRLNKSNKLKGHISPKKGISWEMQFGIEESKERKTKWKDQRKYMILPLKDTKPEIIIQNFLKELNMNFYTHQYRNEIKHSYQCDIFIPIYNLIIECDGNYWHNYPNGREIDKIRTEELIERGFQVLRLWESKIKIMTLEEFSDKLKTYEVQVVKNGQT